MKTELLRDWRRDPFRRDLRRAPPSLPACVAAAALAVGVMIAGVARAEDPAGASDPSQPAAESSPRATTSATTGSTASSGWPPALPNSFFGRFIKWNEIEWGKASGPSDPNAPAGRRPSPWPPQPETTPPMPFTEWPYGGSQSIGANRPASVDSPLMVALAPTPIGKAMAAANLQLYGWVEVGGNISPMHTPGGNAPAGYDYNPNTVQLDQAVLYFERTPDTVQTDHVDWGFRLSAIYGVDYRYTTAYGVASYQLLKHNSNDGYDFPMEYVELYIPKVAQGLFFRVGRYISIPDIEAQLAPNNYMYTHSMTYTFDNFTNTGIQATLAATKNIFLQLGLNAGTESAVWHIGEQLPNLWVLAGNPDPLYPGRTFRKDPGAQPSVSGCLRIQSNDASSDVYFCADAINRGAWGYNNLQWLGITFYHRFNDHWHLSFETWHIQEDGVANIDNPAALAIIAGGGTPFSPQFIPFNAPDGAHCHNRAVLRCNAPEQSALIYVNYSPNPLDNFTVRAEVFDDIVGQRTGVATTYYAAAVGWQHWFSPQIEVRPEIAWYHSANGPAFDGNSNLGIAPTKETAVIAAGDLIVHF